jgi:hypothetical protein
MVHPKYPGETLFLKAHIYKSMTLDGRRCADCDEDHRTISFIAVFLSAARVPAGRDERKSKDPEDVSPAIQLQEVLLKTASFEPDFQCTRLEISCHTC